MEKFNKEASLQETPPIHMTFQYTNEALESNNGEKKLAPPPYVFSNTEPRNKYDLRNVPFEPLLDYEWLGKKNNWKLVTPHFNFFNVNEISAKANNLCNISHSSKYDIWFSNTWYTASDWQKVAWFSTPLCWLASAMRLLRRQYNNKSINEINTIWWYQWWYYSKDEHMTLSAIRIKWISSNARSLNIWPDDLLNLKDADSLKCLSASIANRETSSKLTKEFVDKAYILAFPEEQWDSWILYDFHWNVSYEWELLDWKENGQWKKYVNGEIYDWKRKNWEFTTWVVYDSDWKIIHYVQDGEFKPIEEYRGNITNLMLSALQKNIEKTCAEIDWKWKRWNIKYDWENKTIESWNNKTGVETITVDYMRLNWLDLNLTWGQWMRLANFKNRLKATYWNQKLKHTRWIKSKFEYTFYVGNVKIIERESLERFCPICRDESVREKITRWLNE